MRWKVVRPNKPRAKDWGPPDRGPMPLMGGVVVDVVVVGVGVVVVVVVVVVVGGVRPRGDGPVVGNIREDPLAPRDPMLWRP